MPRSHVGVEVERSVVHNPQLVVIQRFNVESDGVPQSIVFHVEDICAGLHAGDYEAAVLVSEQIQRDVAFEPEASILVLHHPVYRRAESVLDHAVEGQQAADRVLLRNAYPDGVAGPVVRVELICEGLRLGELVVACHVDDDIVPLIAGQGGIDSGAEHTVDVLCTALVGTRDLDLGSGQRPAGPDQHEAVAHGAAYAEHATGEVACTGQARRQIQPVIPVICRGAHTQSEQVAAVVPASRQGVVVDPAEVEAGQAGREAVPVAHREARGQAVGAGEACRIGSAGPSTEGEAGRQIARDAYILSPLQRLACRDSRGYAEVPHRADR